MLKTIRQNNKGFTLVELLAAVFIFALLVLAISAVYLAFSKAQARTRASQQILNDAQYALEIMAREIRNDTILDYNPTTADCNNFLGDIYDQCIFLKRDDGAAVAFALDESQTLSFMNLECNNDYSDCSWSGYLYRTTLLSVGLNDVKVTDLGIYIDPSSDPVALDINQQPKVTIKMEVTFSSNRSSEQVNHMLQTTVSSRIYKK